MIVTGWFTGLSGKFLGARTARLLVLAGTERLDKELMIGQMQGKFQLVVIPNVGHMVHEVRGACRRCASREMLMSSNDRCRTILRGWQTCWSSFGDVTSGWLSESRRSASDRPISRGPASQSCLSERIRRTLEWSGADLLYAALRTSIHWKEVTFHYGCQG